MLNAIYYVPMQFYGFYVWSRHMNPETQEVEKRSMGITGRIWLAAAVILGTIGYGFFLRMLGGSLPFVDALSTVVPLSVRKL